MIKPQHQHEQRHHSVVMSCRTSPARLLSFLFVFCCCCCSYCPFVHAETEVTWTPNPEDEGSVGSLPMSNNQRQQLLELEHAIRTSPDPQGTLMQVAQSNNLDPNDLIQILNQNRAELEAAGLLEPLAGAAGRQQPPIRAALGRLIGLIVATYTRIASKHPKQMAMIIGAMVLMTYVRIQAPRTGLMISHSSKPLGLSSGPTSVFVPPVEYVRNALLLVTEPKPLPEFASKLLINKLKVSEEELEDGLTWHNVKKSKSIQFAVTCQATMDVQTCIPKHKRNLQLQDENELLKEAQALSLEHAETILLSPASRDLTEWVATNDEDSEFSFLRMVFRNHKDEDEEEDYDNHNIDDNAILIVKGMGDFGRYGLLPLQISHELSLEEGNNDCVSLTLSTTPGAHWDGQIHVTIKAATSSSSNTDILVRVQLLVPKTAKRKPSKRVAAQIVQGLQYSITRSLEKRTLQSLVRQAQSARYQGQATKRAKYRRESRDSKERAIEEMATDRRRRWQRQNPNSGHYRPSGDRMRDPRNAVTF